MVLLELHVWGPAFSLPSIDAQCLATIAYFTQAVPSGQWVLVVDSNGTEPGRNVKTLPLLRHDATSIAGFRNIVDYVRDLSRGGWDLDAGLDERARADVVAFSSFLESHGQPILDLSLYVSSQNYTAATRKQLSRLLPWPTQYVTSPALRAAAKARAAHLGLSALDIDVEQPDDSRRTKVDKSQIPESLLRRPKETVTSLLGQPQHSSKIRLDALMTNWLEPLQDLLGGKRYLLDGSHPSSLDCLALGYLALAVYPELEQPWLRETVRLKFTRLYDFTNDLRDQCLGGPVDMDLISRPPQQEQKSGTPAQLPWRVSDPKGSLEIASLLGDELINSIPFMRQLRPSPWTSTTTNHDRSVSGPPQQQDSTTRATTATTLTAAAAAATASLLGYAIYVGLVVALPGRENSATHPPSSSSSSSSEPANLNAFGEAGAALSALADQMDRDALSQQQQQQGGHYWPV